MNLAITTWGAGNSEGLLADWPKEVVELGDSSVLPSDGRTWLLFTTATLAAYKATHRAAYLASKETNASFLKAARERAFKAIDAETAANIGKGFEYPTSSGAFFSLSPSAQTKMIGAYSVRDALTYPVTWNTVADDATISLDAATLPAFVLTGIATVRALLDAGTVAKDAVRAATTLAEISALTPGG